MLSAAFALLSPPHCALFAIVLPGCLGVAGEIPRPLARFFALPAMTIVNLRFLPNASITFSLDARGLLSCNFFLAVLRYLRCVRCVAPTRPPRLVLVLRCVGRFLTRRRSDRPSNIIWRKLCDEHSALYMSNSLPVFSTACLQQLGRMLYRTRGAKDPTYILSYLWRSLHCRCIISQFRYLIVRR